MAIKYLDLTKALSYNKLFTFIIGARGVGKTYASKKHCINRFIKNGEQFVYIRRTKTDLKTIGQFFTDISNVFPEHSFEAKNRNLYIDDKLAGFAFSLTTAATLKSTPFPDVGWIIFDEFIIDKGFQRYLPNEVESFLEMYSTISRLRDVRVIFLSNAITVTNPYFTYFDIDVVNDKEFFTSAEIVVQLVKNDDYANAVYETRFGRLVKDTNYAAYSIENKFLRDSSEFIAKRSTEATLIFNLHTSHDVYGVWYDYKTGIYNVSRDYNPDFIVNYSTGEQAHTEGTEMITKRRPFLYEQFISAYLKGRATFETIQVKNEVLGEIRYA